MPINLHEAHVHTINLLIGKQNVATRLREPPQPTKLNYARLETASALQQRSYEITSEGRPGHQGPPTVLGTGSSFEELLAPLAPDHAQGYNKRTYYLGGA